jgi:hypothetical protein
VVQDQSIFLVREVVGGLELLQMLAAIELNSLRTFPRPTPRTSWLERHALRYSRASCDGPSDRELWAAARLFCPEYPIIHNRTLAQLIAADPSPKYEPQLLSLFQRRTGYGTTELKRFLWRRGIKLGDLLRLLKIDSEGKTETRRLAKLRTPFGGLPGTILVTALKLSPCYEQAFEIAVIVNRINKSLGTNNSRFHSDFISESSALSHLENVVDGHLWHQDRSAFLDLRGFEDQQDFYDALRLTLGYRIHLSKAGSAQIPSSNFLNY